MTYNIEEDIEIVAEEIALQLVIQDIKEDFHGCYRREMEDAVPSKWEYEVAKAALEASNAVKELRAAEERIATLLVKHEKEKALIRIELGDYEEIEHD